MPLITKSLTERKAQEARQDLGVGLDEPVDAERFCKENLEIDVVDLEVEGFTGNLIVVGNEALVSVSTKVTVRPWRQFTVAHEIGHYFLHVDAVREFGAHDTDFTMNDWSHDRHEREANQFAGAFLLPTPLVKRLTYKRPLDWPLVSKVAQECGASLRATARRCVETSQDNVALVVTKGGTMQWYARSASFEGFFLNGRLPTASQTVYNKGDNWLDMRAGEWLSSSQGVNLDAELSVSSRGPDKLQEVLTLVWDETGDVFADDDDDW